MDRADVLVVSSIKIHGIRAAAATKGLPARLAGTAADVVRLQETRVQPEHVPYGLVDGWHPSHTACATARGRNGVSIRTRVVPDARTGIEASESGRCLWRVDQRVVATPGLASRARSAVVERAPSHGERWSDHAPVTVGYGL